MSRKLQRGDDVRVNGQWMRVVIARGPEVLLCHEPEVSAEENAARKAAGLPRLIARTRYEVAPVEACAVAR